MFSRQCQFGVATVLVERYLQKVSEHKNEDCNSLSSQFTVLSQKVQFAHSVQFTVLSLNGQFSHSSQLAVLSQNGAVLSQANSMIGHDFPPKSALCTKMRVPKKGAGAQKLGGWQFSLRLGQFSLKQIQC